MVGIYLSMILQINTVKTRQRLHRRQSQKNLEGEENKRVTVVVILISLVFIICWLPFSSLHLYDNKLLEMKTFGAMILTAIQILKYMIHIVNPLICILASSQFRKASRYIIRKPVEAPIQWTRKSVQSAQKIWQKRNSLNSPTIPKVQVKPTDSYPSVGSPYEPPADEAKEVRQSLL